MSGGHVWIDSSQRPINIGNRSERPMTAASCRIVINTRRE